MCTECAKAKICGRSIHSAASPTGISNSTARGMRRARIPKLSTPATSATSTITIVSVRWKSSAFSAPTSSVPIPPPPTAPTMIDARIAHSNAYVPKVSKSDAVSGISPNAAMATREAPVARSASSGAASAATNRSPNTRPTIAV